MNTFKIMIELGRKKVSPLDIELEKTLFNTLSGQINALDQSDRTEPTLSHHLLLEQTRLMGELSALIKKTIHAWKARNDQFTSLLKDQDDLADLLSDLVSLIRKKGLKKDAQLVTVNKIVAELASSPACVGSVWRVAAQGVRTPFASPNGEQRGGLGWTLPTCAGSSRWVPRGA
jgi:hypothetical protein